MRDALVKGATVGAIVVALTAGCTSSSNKDTTAGSSAKSSARTSTTSLVQNPLPKSVANQPTLRKNVIQTKCSAIPGGWAAEGTARNTGTTALTYKIVVYFTTTLATTLDYAIATVKVAPGETVPWKAAKKFATQPQMLCPMPGISAS